MQGCETKAREGQAWQATRYSSGKRWVGWAAGWETGWGRSGLALGGLHRQQGAEHGWLMGHTACAKSDLDASDKLGIDGEGSGRLGGRLRDRLGRSGLALGRLHRHQGAEHGWLMGHTACAKSDLDASDKLGIDGEGSGRLGGRLRDRLGRSGLALGRLHRHQGAEHGWLMGHTACAKRRLDTLLGGDRLCASCVRLVRPPRA